MVAFLGFCLMTAFRVTAAHIVFGCRIPRRSSFTETNMSGAENLWVVLVGVEFYLPGPRPINLRPLRGCVADVNLIENYFTTRFSLPPTRIRKLTASRNPESDAHPAEHASCLATYENIVRTIMQTTFDASEGDSVYFHFSGHGARVNTMFGAIKGDVNALDEALIPADIRCDNGRYLRDVELAALIYAMKDKNLIVTIVLDSCHSAGATRISRVNHAAVRGLEEVDRNTHQTGSSLISNEDLLKGWSERRAGRIGESWLLEARGYTLLAACRINEEAKEDSFDGQTYGVYTYWLVKSLELIWRPHTYMMLHNRVRAKIYCYDQTPLLAGEGDRIFFGTNRIRPLYSINVIGGFQLIEGSLIILDAGQAHGIAIDSELLLYPRDIVDFSSIQPLAIAKVALVEGVRSQARILARYGHQSGLETGCQAIILRGNPGHRRKIRVFGPTNISTFEIHAAVQRVLSELEDNNWLRAIEDNAIVGAEYQVTVNDSQRYQVWNSIGRPIPHLPLLTTAAELVKCLEHLSRYTDVRDIQNGDPTSALANTLRVEILGKSAGYSPPPRPQFFNPVNFHLEPLYSVHGFPAVVSGEWIVVRIANLSSKPLNISVLNLESTWEISQIYPSTHTDFETLDPGKSIHLPLLMSIPQSLALSPGADGILDVIKVFATVEPTSFLWLELPELSQSRLRELSLSSQVVPQMFHPFEFMQKAALGIGRDSRGSNEYPQWTTEQVMIYTRTSNNVLFSI